MSKCSLQRKYSRFGQAFINYGSYHYNRINKIIHIICIPLIAATLIYLLSQIPYYLILTDLPIINTIKLGIAQFLSTLVIIYYIYLNTLFGIISGILFYLLFITWKTIFKDYTSQEIFSTILYVQIFSWVLQFIGHGVFQKRKPALTDNFIQIFNAPMFVLIELCQLCGLKNEQVDSWKIQIEKNVKEYKQKNKQN